MVIQYSQPCKVVEGLQQFNQTDDGSRFIPLPIVAGKVLHVAYFGNLV